MCERGLRVLLESDEWWIEGSQLVMFGDPARTERREPDVLSQWTHDIGE